MQLALFDLDHTLLDGDSDHAWGMYLAEIGAVDKEKQRLAQDHFYQQYLNSELDIVEFCEYQFKILATTETDTLYRWRSDFIDSVIQPMIDSGRCHLLDEHRKQGDTIIIVTATSDFVTEPIARRLGVENLLACQAEFIDGKYTGKLKGTPSYQGGKVTRLENWLTQNELDFEHTTFYSDSINDLPLLEYSDVAVAVNPDPKLRQQAQQRGWRIVD